MLALLERPGFQRCVLQNFLIHMTTIPAHELDRVRRRTSARTLQRIEDKLEETLQFYSTQPNTVISRRIDELDREWSIERWLETNASLLAFTGTTMGLTMDRRWLALPLLVTGFLFLHAVQGWCPPLPILRRMGVRTRSEIDREKFALKLMRGDFKSIDPDAVDEPAELRRVLHAVNA
jgi:hypothetical protein